jgi:hypothetical protein
MAGLLAGAVDFTKKGNLRRRFSDKFEVGSAGILTILAGESCQKMDAFGHITLKIKDADTLEINFVAFANGKPEPAVRATLRRRGAK